MFEDVAKPKKETKNAPVGETPCSSESVSQNLAPIWLPHWPACNATISRILVLVFGWCGERRRRRSGEVARKKKSREVVGGGGRGEVFLKVERESCFCEGGASFLLLSPIFLVALLSFGARRLIGNRLNRNLFLSFTLSLSAMALSLRCVDCGAQLRSVKEAQDHGEATGHSNFEESTEAILTMVRRRETRARERQRQRACRQPSISLSLLSPSHPPSFSLPHPPPLHTPQVCAECGKPCRSQVEQDMHRRLNPGHERFVDETAARATRKMDTEGEVAAARAAAKEAARAAAPADSDSEGGAAVSKADKKETASSSFEPSTDPSTFVEPAVDAAALEALRQMGFSRNKAVRALHFSSGGSAEHAGNDGSGGSVEGAVAWLEAEEAKVSSSSSSSEAEKKKKKEGGDGDGGDGGNDGEKGEPKPAEDAAALFAARLEEPLLLPPGPPPKPKLSKEEAAAKAAEMLAAAKARRAAEEAAQEKEREANRIRAGKELLLAKRKEEELAVKRAAEARRLEKEEAERARLKVKEKLEEDRRARRMALGLPPELSEEERAAEAAKEAAKAAAEAAKRLPVKPVSALARQRELLVAVKKREGDGGGGEKAKACFETLFKIVANVGTNPAEPKFRRLRLANAALDARVFSVPGALEFLELVGFAREKAEAAADGGAAEEFLVLPEERARPADLQEVAALLDSALNNPMFGAL